MYRESPDDFWRERDNSLTSGIRNENIGCPTIIANREGYVVIVRDTQPPDYGIKGYAVLDFNASPPTITELAEGQRAKDEAIADARRITWTPTGLTLSYFGYPRAQPGGSIDSPRPRAHEVGFDFESRAVNQLK